MRYLANPVRDIDAWKALIVACALTLSACESQPLATARAGTDGREVSLIAETPDGTKLWRYYDGYRTVYFASTGTQFDEQRGKTKVTVHVPTIQESGD